MWKALGRLGEAQEPRDGVENLKSAVRHPGRSRSNASIKSAYITQILMFGEFHRKFNGIVAISGAAASGMAVAFYATAILLQQVVEIRRRLAYSSRRSSVVANRRIYMVFLLARKGLAGFSQGCSPGRNRTTRGGRQRSKWGAGRGDRTEFATGNLVSGGSLMYEKNAGSVATALVAAVIGAFGAHGGVQASGFLLPEGVDRGYRYRQRHGRQPQGARRHSL